MITRNALALWFLLGVASTTAVKAFNYSPRQQVISTLPTYEECWVKWRAVPEADANAALQKLDSYCRQIIWDNVVQQADAIRVQPTPTVPPLDPLTPTLPR